MPAAEIDVHALRTEADSVSFRDPLRAQRLMQIVTLCDVAAELHRKVRILLDREGPPESRSAAVAK